MNHLTRWISILDTFRFERIVIFHHFLYILLCIEYCIKCYIYKKYLKEKYNKKSFFF